MQMRLMLAALVLIGSVTAVFGHEAWLNNKMVDPETKNLCCSEADCHPIPQTTAHAISGGYFLDDTGETIPWPRVQPSPDGAFWACRWGGETKCLFAPMQGS